MHLKRVVANNFKEIAKQPHQKMHMYKCKFCTQCYAHHVTRIAKHLKDCRGCPLEIKNQIRRMTKRKRVKKSRTHRHRDSSQSSGSTTTDEIDEIDIDSSLTAPTESGSNKENEIATGETSGVHSSVIKQKTVSSGPVKIRSFCDNMTEKDTAHAQKLLAKAIYASGTPLNMTQNSHWQEFLTYLRPAFAVPTRRQISEKFLEEVYTEVKSEVDKKVMAASCVGLQCDGWSNIRNEGIVNIVLTTPEPIFFKSIPTGTNSETSAYIAAELTKVIDEIGASKVLGICTDNAAVMKAAWRILQTQYESNTLVFYGCAAHTLNLLIKDVMKLPAFDRLAKNVKSLVKEIKHSHVLSATFAALQAKDPQNITTTLKLPVITRWGSIVTCSHSISVNKHNLQALAIDQSASKHLNSLTKSLLLDEEFWIQTEKILYLIEPVASWIRMLEGDMPKLSCVPEAFVELERHFEKELKTASLPPLPFEESTVAIDAVRSRRAMAVTAIHLAANILDPAFKGKKLSEEDQVSGTVLIHEIAVKFGLDIDKVLSELADYTTDEGLWKETYVQQASSSTAASKWWKGICHKTTLSKVAQEVLNLPATSAATERSFSTHGWIHNSKRNRLTVRRAATIAHISYNMRLFKDSRAIRQTKSQTRFAVETSSNSEPSEEEDCAAEGEYQDEEYLDET